MPSAPCYALLRLATPCGAISAESFPSHVPDSAKRILIMISYNSGCCLTTAALRARMVIPKISSKSLRLRLSSIAATTLDQGDRGFTRRRGNVMVLNGQATIDTRQLTYNIGSVDTPSSPRPATSHHHASSASMTLSAPSGPGQIFTTLRLARMARSLHSSSVRPCAPRRPTMIMSHVVTGDRRRSDVTTSS